MTLFLLSIYAFSLLLLKPLSWSTVSIASITACSGIHVRYFLTDRVHPEKASDDNRQPKSKRLYPTMASTVDNWWRQTGRPVVSLALLPYASVQNRHQCTKLHDRSMQPTAKGGFTCQRQVREDWHSSAMRWTCCCSLSAGPQVR